VGAILPRRAGELICRSGARPSPALSVPGGTRPDALPRPVDRPRSVPFLGPCLGDPRARLVERPAQRDRWGRQRRSDVRRRGWSQSRADPNRRPERFMRATAVPRLTIGIEEEFQIVDSEGQLKSHSETLLAAARPRLGEQIKPEMMQSVIEAGTKICADLSQARGEMSTLRGELAAVLASTSRRSGSDGACRTSHCT